MKTKIFSFKMHSSVLVPMLAALIVGFVVAPIPLLAAPAGNRVPDASAEGRPGTGNPGLSRSLLEQSFHEDDVQALRTLVRALKADPGNLEAAFRIAYLLQKMNRLSESTEYYERVLRLSPCHEKSLNNLAGIRFLLKDMDGAEGYYRKSIACNGHFYLSQYNLGNVLHAKGDLEEAAKAYEMALNLNEAHYRSHTNLAIVLRELAGRSQTPTEKRDFYLQEALSHATRACEIAPEDPINHSVRASAFQDLGYFDEAIQELATAERLYSGEPSKRVAIQKRIENLRALQKSAGQVQPDQTR